MTRMRLWASAAIIALIILISFALSVPHTRDLKNQAAMSATEAVPAVSVRTAYRAGVHTISGSVLTPDACTSVSASAEVVAGEAGERIHLAISMPPSEGVCLELPTPASYETSVTAAADLPVVVTVNGETASTTSS